MARSEHLGAQAEGVSGDLATVPHMEVYQDTNLEDPCIGISWTNAAVHMCVVDAQRRPIRRLAVD